MLASDPLLELEHWASVSQRKGVPMIAISAKSSYCCSLKDTSVAGDQHQLTVFGFWQSQLHKENIVIRNLPCADRNSMSRFKPILIVLCKVRSPAESTVQFWAPNLKKVVDAHQKIQREQSRWGDGTLKNNASNPKVGHLFHSQFSHKATINILQPDLYRQRYFTKFVKKWN